MLRVTKADKASQPQVKTFFAYGFDKDGFKCPDKPLDMPGFGTVRFVRFTDGDKLDEADGVIAPTGIFEEFVDVSAYSVKRYKVHVERDLLIERERQLLNLVKDGKWVCFLAKEIIDCPTQYSQDASDTDLCKRFLNILSVKRTRASRGLQASDSLCVEFNDFVRDYAIAKTLFEIKSDGNLNFSIIAKCGSSIVAFEAARKVFVLPFHTTLVDALSLSTAIQVVVKAVVNYRKNRHEDIPEWADSFEFTGETTLKHELDALEKRIVNIRERICHYRINKSILMSSGDALRDRLIIILRDYFGLNIDPLDEHREDAKVVDDKKQPLVLLEFKAMGGGVGREDVSQLNFHRDGTKLADDIPGVLIANCNRKVTSIEERLTAQVDGRQIHYAKSLNVLIIRTIDLLVLMRQLEDKPVVERRELLMKAFTSGGGWLKTTETSHEIVTA